MTTPEDAKSSASQPKVDAVLTPVPTAERIDLMDILRGFALIGILLMNIEWFGRSLSEIGTFDRNLSGLDHAVGWLVRCFIEGKFFRLFTLLFGMGFAIMLIRARERDKPFTAWFLRRMGVLFIIGVLHRVFFWTGDILQDYAFAGMLFLGLISLFRRERFQKFDNPRSFLKIGLIWLFLPGAIAVITGIGFGSYYDHSRLQAHWQEVQEISAQVESLKEAAENERESEQADLTDEGGSIEKADSTETRSQESSEEELSPEELLAKKAKEKFDARTNRKEKSNEEVMAYSDGSYWQATQFRIKDTLFRLMFTLPLSLSLLLPIFFLGYWLISSGIIREHRKHSRFFKYMTWIGMGFGLAFTIGGLLVLQHPAVQDLALLVATGFILFGMGQNLMASGYLGLITCMVQSERWQNLLSKLIPMGRMALTNYILQTVILSGIFHGYAGGLFGEISRAPQMLIVIAILIIQIYFSKWWLANYRFGPLEWLWRSLTYKRLQPMKLAEPGKA